LEVDSTLKELERAKADAQNVTASEALAQRKLADAEAALQRTKEEAERATNEAQRAKADAQAARESEAAAKRKLADAEAARTAAEGRCQSAAKSQPGFGARLRKWFEPERSNPKNP
jgi:chromosome segregation ATPase